jgi:hypothetical protein
MLARIVNINESPAVDDAAIEFGHCPAVHYPGQSGSGLPQAGNPQI